ncbi:MAG: Holliday junction branch migration protein RuvA [Patescibacteria group bacterium]|nr:Holliday junction branch migration protein RuvA [Patescibacteria group bacterium]
MIGFINGKVELRDDPYLIVDVNGVGYRVLVSPNVLSNLSETEEKIKLFIYTHVREDTLDLYGFIANSDLKLFENLLSVSGIGPKTAIGIFSLGSSPQIIDAIRRGEVDFFTAVPRLGKKNAQKIIIELKNKMGGVNDLDLSEKDVKENEVLISALKTFGFSSREALDALKNIKGKGETTEERVKLALKYLGK